MLVIGLDLLVLIVGLLMYVLATGSPTTAPNVKVQEIGRIMFAFGLLALLLGGDRIISVVTQAR